MVFICHLSQLGELLLCEHDPVYTFGLRQSLHQTEAAKLRLLGCETHQVWPHSYPFTSSAVLCVGEEGWSDHLPWPRTTGVLSCTQHQETQGTITPSRSTVQGLHTPSLPVPNFVPVLQRGVREYVRSLEQAVIATLMEFGVEGFTTCNTGVWVAHPVKGESKICSLGEAEGKVSK